MVKFTDPPDCAGSSIAKMTSVTCDRMRARVHQVHKTVDRYCKKVFGVAGWSDCRTGRRVRRKGQRLRKQGAGPTQRTGAHCSKPLLAAAGSCVLGGARALYGTQYLKFHKGHVRMCGLQDIVVPRDLPRHTQPRAPTAPRFLEEESFL